MNDNARHKKAIYNDENIKAITVSLNVELHKDLQDAADVLLRSKRLETMARLMDSLKRVPAVKIIPFGKRGQQVNRKAMSLFLDKDIDRQLMKVAMQSGRHKYVEAELRIQAHIDQYELFVTPELFKLRNRG